MLGRLVQNAIRSVRKRTPYPTAEELAYLQGYDSLLDGVAKNPYPKALLPMLHAAWQRGADDAVESLR